MTTPAPERNAMKNRRSTRKVTLGVTALLVTGCSGGRGVPTSATEVRAEIVTRLPVDPMDGAWDTVVAHNAALLMQDMVEPRKMTVTLPAMPYGWNAASGIGSCEWPLIVNLYGTSLFRAIVDSGCRQFDLVGYINR